MKLVAVIIVNWNGKSDTLACLKSLENDSYPNKSVIVVDNGSEDDSVDAIQTNYSKVEVLPTGRNLGFTGGNNAGIRQAISHGVDYVLLLNNDTVVEHDAISALMDSAAQHPEAGILTPLIHYFDCMDKAWFSGSSINLSRGEAWHENGSPISRDAAVRELPWASGCAMLIPTALIEELGGFDNRFFLNWEDLDLSLRARKKGRKILLVPSALIYHKVGQAFAKAHGAGLYYYVRNRLLVLRIHVKRHYLKAYIHSVLDSIRSALRALRYREANCWRAMRLVLRAIFDDLSGRFGDAKNL